MSPRNSQTPPVSNIPTPRTVRKEMIVNVDQENMIKVYSTQPTSPISRTGSSDSIPPPSVGPVVLYEWDGTSTSRPTQPVPTPRQIARMTVNELREIFEELDKNHDGEVSHAEFIKGLRKKPELARKLGMEASFGQESAGRDDYVRMFNSMDVDGNKQISFEEMVQAYAPHAASGLSAPQAPKATKTEASSAPKAPAADNFATNKTSDPAPRTPSSSNSERRESFASFSDARSVFQNLQARTGLAEFSQSQLMDAFKSNPSSAAKMKGSSENCLSWVEEQTTVLYRSKYGPDSDSKLQTISVGEFCRFFAAGLAPQPSIVPRDRDEFRRALKPESVVAPKLENSGVFEVNGQRVNGDLWGFDGSSGHWKRRKFYLDGQTLEYQQEDESSRGFGPKTPIQLFSSSILEVMSDEMLGKDNCITLTTREGGDCYLISADSKLQRNQWVRALELQGVTVTVRDFAFNNFMKFSFPCLFGNPLF
eukprot:CAMPEP_0184289060 /NCGR_PEP_ID=MMETSP1049-20130417/1535_1 /TAXON_ID=77928 /ORGANISM="Proteomonas sulcata, Strain CCMP704" /LENGTH=478 /DNA_ID=CAMNT_0026595709 /DNA_START=77 /DNA_END=1513 /DNA_ORIENTATION=-